jgi:hypothetical protein
MSMQAMASMQIVEGRAEDWVAAAQRWGQGAAMTSTARRRDSKTRPAPAVRTRKSLWAMLGVCCVGFCLL